MNTVSIVRVVTRLNVGGPTRQIASLMKRLDPARFRQVLVEGAAAQEERAGLLLVSGERVSIASLKRPIAPLADWSAYRALLGLFRERRPIIVHTHQGKAGLLGRLAAARAGVPLIVHTYHGHTFRGYFRGPVATGLRMLERRAASVSTALIAQADGQRDDITRHLGDAAGAKTRVIRPGVEPPEREAAPHRGAGVRIVFPARLEAIKDPMLLLDVMERLPADHHASVFGDGALRGAFEARVARDARLGGRVSIHPVTADPAAIYDGASVTLLTSREEGTPLALVESQWHGVPVVAPDVGAVRSVIAPGGGRCVARDADALAAAILEVAHAQVDAGARAWIAERFDAGRMVRETAALYEDLMAAGEAR